MAEHLKDLSEYLEYRDGGLFWKKLKNHRGPKVGQRYGTEQFGYRQGSYDGHNYKEHRLIWFLHYGYLPKCIDHIDGNGLNNSLENLREVTQSQNLLNTGKRSTNTTGHKNVYFNKAAKKYQVQLFVDKKVKYIGTFDDLELAALVAEEARNKYHGEYARHE